MIQKLLTRLFRRKTAAPAGATKRPAWLARARASTEPVQYSGSKQGVHLQDVSHAAVRTCETLQKAGFKAFIVGGGVRDLLLGLKPKDFDVATDATPDQVTKLFRRSRVIGRRFQIVHVMFGRETIEVSTFRALRADAETDEHGRVLRDNVWGTQAEDATRRDFTINALYFDPVADLILDYHDGVKDLQRRTLRMIGDPATRYREDPVRMLRTARFAGKTGFNIEAATRAPIRELASLLHNVPAARLFDEMLKLFHGGCGRASFEMLRRHGLFHCLCPLTDKALDGNEGEFVNRLLTAALDNTDLRIAEGKPVTPAFLFAALLWQSVEDETQTNVANGLSPVEAVQFAADTVISKQVARIAMSRRFTSITREIWALQPRLMRHTSKRAPRLVEHPRFRAAYDFLLLRAAAGEPVQEAADWWTNFLGSDEAGRAQLMESGNHQGSEAGRPKRRRRRGGRTRRSADNAGA